MDWSVYYTNLNSLNAKFDELLVLVSDQRPDFILITESWLSPEVPDGLVHIQGYNLLRADRVGRVGGGVCAYVSDEVLE